MPRPDPVSAILAAYPVIHHALRQRDVAASAAAPSVSSHQLTVLAHLDLRTGRTLTELAGLLGVTLSTMSLLVSRLVAADLIRRDRDPDDGRRVALRLTPAGEHLLARRSLLDPERVRGLVATLSPAERAAGVAGLRTLARAVERIHLEPDPAAGSSESS